MDDERTTKTVNRRSALKTIGVAMAVAPIVKLLAACSSSVDASASATSSASGAGGAGGSGGATSTGGGGATTTASTGSATCAVTPEGEIGPYFADDSDPLFNRSNLTTNIDGSSEQPGIPLVLTIKIVDSEKSCAPYANAQVDIWHCNASGVYSDEGVEDTTGLTWLRGFQLTDANGEVTFTTIVPGWYQGRTTHIHLRVRSTYSDASSTSDGTNTTQVFFPQDLVDTISTTVVPYNAEGVNPTTNANDHVSSGEQGLVGVLTLTGDNDTGYSASYTVVLPIAAATGGTGGGPMP